MRVRLRLRPHPQFYDTKWMLRQMQRIGVGPILCICVSISTMLNFDAKVDANVTGEQSYRQSSNRKYFLSCRYGDFQCSGPNNRPRYGCRPRILEMLDPPL